MAAAAADWRTPGAMVSTARPMAAAARRPACFMYAISCADFRMRTQFTRSVASANVAPGSRSRRRRSDRAVK